MADFWDTHDVTDYLTEMEKADLVVELDGPKDETLVLRMQKPVKERLEQVARKKGLSASTLARMWLMERLQGNAH